MRSWLERPTSDKHPSLLGLDVCDEAYGTLLDYGRFYNMRPWLEGPSY
jgi:hypothetical protein